MSQETCEFVNSMSCCPIPDIPDTKCNQLVIAHTFYLAKPGGMGVCAEHYDQMILEGW